MNLKIAQDWLNLAPLAFTSALRGLSFREREVLCGRLGMKGSRLTLLQCAKNFGISVSRVRQIEGRACRTMYNLLRYTVNGQVCPPHIIHRKS